MNKQSATDLDFDRRFASGELPAADFDHKAHLRLAYGHLAIHGPDKAVSTFREALQCFSERDPGAGWCRDFGFGKSGV